MISLDLKRYTGISRVSVRHRTSAEVDEVERLAKEEAERERQRLAKKRVKVKVAVPLPVKAANVEQLGDSAIEFTLATGGGKEALDGFREHFVKEGWKEDDGSSADANTGHLSFTKDEASLRFSYIDSGLTDAEITISGSGVVLTPARSKAASKDAPKSVA